MDTCVSGCAGTQKPAEVRQGKGKGTVEYWAARVKPGRIMFEVDGVSKEIATVALELAAAKLPVQTKVVTRLVGEETNHGECGRSTPEIRRRT